MFDKEYDILGKHAIYVRFLARDYKINGQSIFERYLDVGGEIDGRSPAL